MSIRNNYDPDESDLFKDFISDLTVNNDNVDIRSLLYSIENKLDSLLEKINPEKTPILIPSKEEIKKYSKW